MIALESPSLDFQSSHRKSRLCSAVRSKSRLVTGKEQVATCGAVQSRDLHALKKQTF